MANRKKTDRENGYGGAVVGQAAGGRFDSYIREKINQLLVVMGTKPLDMEMLDEKSLLDLDPIGTIACSFEQVLDHLRDTNKKLRVAKDQLQAVFDTAGVCISIIDPELRVINCNEKQRELLASENKGDLRGRYCYEVYCGNDSPALACPAIETIETGRPVFIREIKKKGRYFQIVTSPLKDADGRLTAIIEVSVDVTEKKKAEEGRRQAEKLAAVGLLGAGLAHEINNPLGNILGYSKMLLMEGDLTERQKERLEIIAEQARKGSEIIKGLLDFSRQSSPAFEPVDPDRDNSKSDQREFHAPPGERRPCRCEVRGSPRHKGRSGADRPGNRQSDTERDTRNGGHKRPSAYNRNRFERQRNRNQRDGQRHRHSGFRGAEDLRSVFHHQARRQGCRPRPFNMRRDHKCA